MSSKPNVNFAATWQNLTGSYKHFWSSALRPPRAIPSASEMAGNSFWGVRRGEDEPVLYRREEFTLVSDRGHALQCSYFGPEENSTMEPTPRPCVVYLHGMSGCRLDVVSLLPHLLRYDITVCSLDFSGCGESEGDYVSLGHHEQQDLRVVLDHLRGVPSVSSVALWGWSMGAVVAILRASEDDAIAACVLDSPFTDLPTVFRELVDTAMPTLPHIFLWLGMEMVRLQAKSRANFDPSKLRPIDRAPKASCPALFGVAKNDSITRPHHIQELFRLWGGTKRMATFDGDHQTIRPDSFLQDAAAFLWHHLHLRAIADGRPFAETPKADAVFLVEPDGAFHRSVSNRCQSHFHSWISDDGDHGASKVNLRCSAFTGVARSRLLDDMSRSCVTDCQQFVIPTVELGLEEQDIRPPAY